MERIVGDVGLSFVVFFGLRWEKVECVESEERFRIFV